MSASPSLDDMPAEVIWQIMGHIEQNACRLNVSLCCHKLHKLALNPLYTRVDISEERKKARFPRFESFAFKIIKNHELARYVFELKLDLQSKPYQTAHCCEHERLANAHQEALLATILQCCPNLRRLELLDPPIGTVYTTKQWSNIIRRSTTVYDVPPPLSQLEEVVIHSNCMDETKSSALINGFLQLPSLRIFRARQIQNKDT